MKIKNYFNRMLILLFFSLTVFSLIAKDEHENTTTKKNELEDTMAQENELKNTMIKDEKGKEETTSNIQHKKASFRLNAIGGYGINVFKMKQSGALGDMESTTLKSNAFNLTINVKYRNYYFESKYLQYPYEFQQNLETKVVKVKIVNALLGYKRWLFGLRYTQDPLLRLSSGQVDSTKMFSYWAILGYKILEIKKNKYLITNKFIVGYPFKIEIANTSNLKDRSGYLSSLDNKFIWHIKKWKKNIEFNVGAKLTIGYYRQKATMTWASQSGKAKKDSLAGTMLLILEGSIN